VDADTLVIVICITAAVMGTSMLALYLASPDYGSLRDWALAGLAFFLFGLTALPALREPERAMAMIAISNTLLACGHAALWVGLRRLLGLRPGWRWMALLAALLMALHQLPWVQAAAGNRLLLLWPLMISLNLGLCWQAWRSPGFGARSPLLPLTLLALLHALQMAVRMALAIDWQSFVLSPPQYTGARRVGLLLLFLHVLLGAMACAYAVIRSQALQLKGLSETDTLTGWLNRRRLEPALAAAQAQSRRYDRAFALLVFDIDHFKRVNDGHGHGVGDRALAHVAGVVADALRDVDLRFRIGGEEFLVLLPPESAAQALAVAERLRAAVAGAPLRLPGGGSLALTVSVGAAVHRAPDEPWEATLQRADAALYQAKQQGRNRCVLDASTDGTPPGVTAGTPGHFP